MANSWGAVLGVRWADRVGKGICTAPRDALPADSIQEDQRGLALRLHRAADTAGAMLGLIIAFLVVWSVQSTTSELGQQTFRRVVLLSLVPAVLAVVSLTIGARDVEIKEKREPPSLSLKGFSTPYGIYNAALGLLDFPASLIAGILWGKGWVAGMALVPRRLLPLEQCWPSSQLY